MQLKNAFDHLTVWCEPIFRTLFYPRNKKGEGCGLVWLNYYFVTKSGHCGVGILKVIVAAGCWNSVYSAIILCFQGFKIKKNVQERKLIVLYMAQELHQFWYLKGQSGWHKELLWATVFKFVSSDIHVPSHLYHLLYIFVQRWLYLNLFCTRVQVLFVQQPHSYSGVL